MWSLLGENGTAIAKKTCRIKRDELARCKSDSYGLDFDEPYPPVRVRGGGGNDGCIDYEWELKKCVAFAVDKRNAEVRSVCWSEATNSSAFIW